MELTSNLHKNIATTSCYDRRLQFLIFIFFAFCLYAFSFLESMVPFGLILVLFAFFSGVINKSFPISLLIITYSLNIPTKSIYLILSLLISLIWLCISGKKLKLQHPILFVFGFIIFIVSYFFGIDPDYKSLIFQLCAFATLFLIVSSTEKDLLFYLIAAFFIAALFVCFSLGLSVLRGETILLSGRLTYNSNVRALANILSFPILYLVFDLLFHKKRRFVFIKSICLFLFVTLLILSFSRGNIIAVIVPICFMMVAKYKRKSIVLISVLAVSAFAWLSLSSTQSTMLMTGGESFEERLTIWGHYFTNGVTNGITRFFFGAGSGDIRRTATNAWVAKYYAHSAIFDYFFCYGCFGFILLMCVLTKTAKKAISVRSVLGVSIFALTFLMFISYGTSDYLIMYVLLGMCFLSSRFEKGEAKNGNSRIGYI